MKRGDVVIVEFPYVDGKHGKNRPALVVQNDRDNRRLTNTIVAMISGNIRHSGEASQVLVDPNQATGALSGLHGPSVVKCSNLFTIRKQDIQRVIGQLSPEYIKSVNSALRDALGVA
jgi:mRNA-degrading endonuclease toxin of MazEF toxin-antitoxin module